MNIVFWNCQGLRPKRKELQNYLLENQIDILALNETFLKPKFKFHLPGYDIYKNDRLVGTKGGVAILVKKSIIVNQEWKNEHFNVITDNEALAIEIELQNGDKVILATIYCPNGSPSLRLFRMINALSKQVIFLGGFNSKHKQFGCVKPNKSGQTLLNIAKDLKLFYVNQLEPNRHTRGFRKSKSTNDHLFRLSQTIMESFNWGEHVIAAFLDVQKAFDNVWHNGLGYKIYQLDLPTKLCRWLSDFLVVRVIQVKIEGLLSPNQKFVPKQVFYKVQTWVHYFS